MNKSLTIVLPIHNGESRLRKSIDEILELAGELTDRFSILILDDGSTDDTYDVAGELANRFPQISVRRHSSRRGLGPALALVRRYVKSDVVVVHDGVSPLDPKQVRRLWQQCTAAEPATGGAASGVDLTDLAEVSSTHAAMAHAHRSVAGFHLIHSLLQPGDTDTDVSDERTDRNRSDRREESGDSRPAGIGRIPPLPRPNFLEVVAEFALGE